MKKTKCKEKGRRPHPMVEVKVNALVDVGIAPLVLALSNLPVWTIDSCEGLDNYPGKSGKVAYVCFRYLGPAKREAAFFANLAETMGMAGQEESLFSMRFEWRCGGSPLAQIVCAPEAIVRVAKIVHSAANCDRMTAFLGELGD